ncbi:hypothetical protein AGMMS49944_09040 [Spirochaetia bacterium]|nr:hypothetical protein AGMMS49944_09040 [Spirochaetia bacterium]
MKEQDRAGSMLNFSEKQQAKGILSYRVFKNGVLVEEVEEENLIVTVGRTTMAKLLAGDAAGNPVTKISLGTSGLTPALTDTAITNPYTKNLNSYSFPGAGQVQFNWSLGTGEANGKAILEFGLLCSDNSLFSRRIRESGKPINKEADISLEGTWTIIF